MSNLSTGTAGGMMSCMGGRCYDAESRSPFRCKGLLAPTSGVLPTERLQLSAIFSTASIEEDYLMSGVPCSHGNQQPMLVKRTHFRYFPISNLLPMECTIMVAWALEKE